jgi:hypothetical protein
MTTSGSRRADSVVTTSSQTANLVVVHEVPWSIYGSAAQVAGIPGTPIDATRSPCHFFAPKSCTIMIQLKNTGNGCAGNIRGTMTQYRDTTSRPLFVAASTDFTGPDMTVTPNETVVINARFATFSFDALGNGEYCPFVFIVPSWDDISCP